MPVYYILIPVLVALFLAYWYSDDRFKSVIYGINVFLFFVIAGYMLYSQEYNSVSSFKAIPGIYTIRVDKKPVSREKSLKAPSSIMTGKQGWEVQSTG